MPATSARLHEPDTDLVASITGLPSRFLPERAPAGRRRYRLCIDGFPPFTILVSAGACFVWPSAGAAPDAELRTDAGTWRRVSEGVETGLDAFVDGRLRVRGDLNEALRMETLFALPPGAPAADAQGEVRRHDLGRGVVVETFEAGPVDAPPVLLLHGLGASKVSLAPAIAGLARHHRVIAVDQPGFGSSSAPRGAPYHAPWFAEVTQALLDAVGAERVAVVGNSLGGRIGVELALRAPARVRALGLLCPAVAFNEYRYVRPLLAATRADVAFGSSPWPVTTPMARTVVHHGLRSLFADPARVPAANLAAARDDALRTLASRPHRCAFLAAARHLGIDKPRRFWHRLARLEVPSLWVFGDHDRLVSARYAHRVAEVLPAAAVEVWPSTGHVPQFEHPQRTLARLEGFLTANP